MVGAGPLLPEQAAGVGRPPARHVLLVLVSLVFPSPRGLAPVGTLGPAPPRPQLFWVSSEVSLTCCCCASLAAEPHSPRIAGGERSHNQGARAQPTRGAKFSSLDFRTFALPAITQSLAEGIAAPARFGCKNYFATPTGIGTLHIATEA
jgi:hypothetical protein